MVLLRQAEPKSTPSALSWSDIGGRGNLEGVRTRDWKSHKKTVTRHVRPNISPSQAALSHYCSAVFSFGILSNYDRVNTAASMIHICVAVATTLFPVGSLG